eukprot:scaffold6899_cov183-Amphora_coffeaeformis.AAC.10
MSTRDYSSSRVRARRMTFYSRSGPLQNEGMLLLLSMERALFAKQDKHIATKTTFRSVAVKDSN